ncbi:ionotropic glutamate receptor, metazoa, Periplasmic binding protein-like I [Artemisia annua]|uniref:Ionotropic glutamate receptor, metazoa, Periplasmic binding protein-like I n=1 Tax=Artemisia annua TaxID=35608 RepID=A0A2U1M0U8_ARTAN|nr:ionotropic glutamate receptor, metazoa, Periplasmic binding protein-like I [Artemisia annua]
MVSSMITVSRFHPSLDLHHNNYVVGCNGNSFISHYLVHVLHFSPKNIRHINSIEEYHESFKKGQIDAAFFVSPHANVFLAKYCQGYEKFGSSIKLSGFSFVFPKGSTLAEDMSEAVLKETENGKINILEENMLRTFSRCSQSAQESNVPRGLDPQPFIGLFIVSGSISAIVFFTILTHLIAKRKDLIWNWIQLNLIRIVEKWLTLSLQIRSVHHDPGVELTPNQTAA